MSEYFVNTKFNRDIIEQTIGINGDLISDMTNRILKLQDDGVKKALAELGYLTPEQASNLTAQVEELKAQLNKQDETSDMLDRAYEVIGEDDDELAEIAYDLNNYSSGIAESKKNLAKLLTRTGEDNE